MAQKLSESGLRIEIDGPSPSFHEKIGDKYLNKKHLINQNFIYLLLPRAARNKKIKTIKIVPQENEKILICYSYEVKKKKNQTILIGTTLHFFADETSGKISFQFPFDGTILRKLTIHENADWYEVELTKNLNTGSLFIFYNSVN